MVLHASGNLKEAGKKNEYYDITVDLKNEKILPGAGLSKSGNVTDSYIHGSNIF